MGIVLGKVSVETPKHRVLFAATTPTGLKYEVRQYPPAVAAEVRQADIGKEGQEFTGDGFRTLARYIGVFGTPANTARNPTEGSTAEAIAMTAPVLMGNSSGSAESIAMTAPVISSREESGDEQASPSESGGEEVMMFLLPDKYQSVSEAPVPDNPIVKLKDIPTRVLAAETFSGNWTRATATEKAALLAEALDKDERLAKVHSKVWELAGFNPPMTPGPLKTNEILIPVDLVPGTFEQSEAAG